MKKTLILTSLLAIVATGAASADTDVTFAGDYETTAGTKNVETGAPAAYEFNYHGTAANGDSTNETSDTSAGVDKSNFAYTLADGVSTETLADNQEYLATDYVADTVAGSGLYNKVHTADNYAVNAADAVSDSSYSYENPQYDSSNPDSEQYIVLDHNGSARTLSASYGTDATYTSGTATITSDTVAEDLIGLYSYQIEGGHRYVLSEDGTGVRDLDNDGQGVDLTNPAIEASLRDALQGMIDAFASDSGANLIDAVDAITVLQTQENQNFGAALDAYNQDTTKHAELVGLYGTYTTAKTAYNNETAAESNYQTTLENYNTDYASYSVASDLYNSPIETTIATGANDAIDASVAGGTIKTALDTKANSSDVDAIANDLATNYSTTAQIEAGITDLIATKEANISEQLGYDVSKNPANAEEPDSLTSKLKSHDTSIVAAINTNYDAISDEKARATAAELQIRDDFAAADAETLASAKAYSDAGDALTLNTAKAYADAGNTVALNQAKAYTDERVEKLDKDLSAGVASAIALSSVSVSGVKRGEVSVGGGYGYFNGQSAAAFGAAMGLSDRWSINAGAGVSNADIALRAGTNYKFKLF